MHADRQFTRSATAGEAADESREVDGNHRSKTVGGAPLLVPNHCRPFSLSPGPL